MSNLAPLEILNKSYVFTKHSCSSKPAPPFPQVVQGFSGYGIVIDPMKMQQGKAETILASGWSLHAETGMQVSGL